MEKPIKVYPQQLQTPIFQNMTLKTPTTIHTQHSSSQQAPITSRCEKFTIHVHQPHELLTQPTQPHHLLQPQLSAKRTREVSFRQPDIQKLQTLANSTRPQLNAKYPQQIQPIHPKEQNISLVKLSEPNYIYGNLSYITDLVAFLSTPIQRPNGYILNIHTVKHDSEYSITFDANIQIIRCYRSSSNYLFENADGPVFCLNQINTNLYLTQFQPFRTQSSPRIMIAYQKSHKNKKAFLNTQVFRLYPQVNQPTTDYKLPTLKQSKIKGQLQFAARKPALQNTHTPKLQINVANRKQLLKGNRPSQYHCLIQDRHKNDVCLLLQKEHYYKIWVQSPMTPIQALCCGVSRIHCIKKTHNSSP